MEKLHFQKDYKKLLLLLAIQAVPMAQSNLVEKNLFWVILQDGLVCADPLARKRSLYIIKIVSQRTVHHLRLVYRLRSDLSRYGVELEPIFHAFRTNPAVLPYSSHTFVFALLPTGGADRYSLIDFWLQSSVPKQAPGMGSVPQLRTWTPQSNSAHELRIPTPQF